MTGRAWKRYSRAGVIGETIGHFEIVARAGRGGMGEVFIAEQTAIKTRVAIKVLHAQVSANADQVQRFFNEARAAARIPHAGIVKIFDVGFHTSQRAYLIMELLEGETLAARLSRTGQLSPGGTVEIARQIASILDATHHAGIVHRDLKPENVFLVEDRELPSGERVKLLDFGIAKLSDTLSGSPTTVGAIGTPAYMAPEQWSNASTIDWRADAYSLGCIVYQMIAGRPPFISKSIADACAQHLHEVPQPLHRHAADVPPAIDALALRLLAKDPAQRASSIEDLQRELAALAAGAPATADDLAAPRSDGPTRSVPPRRGDQVPAALDTTLSSASTTARRARPGRRVTAAVTGAFAVAGAIAIAALVVWRDDRPARLQPPPVTAQPPPAPASGAGSAAAPEPPFASWLETANPFVAWRGAHWLAHQVTRREYRRFLESLPVRDALRFQPVTGWDDGDAMHPVAWVTFERAAAFCRAAQASLPTSDQWLAAAGGAWGVDPTGVGLLGPLQEWTSTVRDGLVVVCGGHARMSPAEQANAAENPLMKSNEAQAGLSPAPNVVASETIGFRCVR